jgi:Mg2+-importing ATPase
MFSYIGFGFVLPAGLLAMTPLQLLLNNFLYDFSQVGIPLDNVDQEYLDRPRRWNIRSIQNFMVFIGPVSSVFDYATWFLMLYVFGCIAYGHSGTPEATKSHLEQLFHSAWFVESIVTQTLIVHIIRTRRIPFIQSRASPTMLLTTLSVIAVGIWLPFSPAPIAHYLGLVPLPWVFFLWLLLFALTYCVLTHTVKTWFYKRFGVD